MSTLDFESVVPDLVPRLFAAAMTLTRDPHEAEDLVQETLLRAYRAWHTFDGQHPKAWLLTILRNEHIDRLRKRQPSLLRQGTDVVELSDALGIVSESAETSLLSIETERLILELVVTLPDQQRAVLELVDVHGHTYQEAADSLGVPVGTVMSRLHRARRTIRHRLISAGVVLGGMG